MEYKSKTCLITVPQLILLITKASVNLFQIGLYNIVVLQLSEFTIISIKAIWSLTWKAIYKTKVVLIFDMNFRNGLQTLNILNNYYTRKYTLW